MRKVLNFMIVLMVIVGAYDLYAIEQFSRVKVWGREVLTKDDLNAEFDAIINGLNTKLLNGTTTFTIIAGDSILVEGRATIDTLRVRTIFLLEGDIVPDADGLYNIGTNAARVDTFFAQDANIFKIAADTIVARADSVLFTSEVNIPTLTVDNFTINGDSLLVGTARAYLAPWDAIVDSAGVLSTYTQVDQAIDAGHKNIFIVKGTYSPFDADVSDLHIQGESWDVIIDGGTTDDAIDITGANAVIKNLSVRTTSGSDNADDGIYASGGGNCRIIDVQFIDFDAYGFRTTSSNSKVINCYFATGDLDGIHLAGDKAQVIGCYVGAMGGQGIQVTGTGDNFMVTGNHIVDTVSIAAGGDNGVLDGNITDGAITDNGTGNTIGDNETY